MAPHTNFSIYERLHSQKLESTCERSLDLQKRLRLHSQVNAIFCERSRSSPSELSKGFPPDMGGSPLRAPKAKRQGERAGNSNLLPFLPAFLPSEVSKGFLQCQGGKPFETSEGNFLKCWNGLQCVFWTHVSQGSHFNS